MTRDELKNRIVEIVTEKQGCKVTELCVLPELVLADDGEGNGFSIPELVEELALEERIIEIQYVIPAMDYRIKSFLFPVGTEIKSGVGKSPGESKKG